MARPRLKELLATWQSFKEDASSNIKSSKGKNRLIAFSKLILLVVFIILVPVIFYLVSRDTLFSSEWMANLPSLLDKHRSTAFAILVIMQFVQIVICFLPGEPIQVVSSYFYGIVGGYFVALIGAVLGSIVAFSIAKFLGNDAIHLIFGKEKVSKYRSRLNSGKALTIVLLIYLIPAIPKDLVAYIAGISDMKLAPFIVVSTIGRTPGIIGSLLIGAFWQAKNYFGLVLVLVAACVILAVSYVKRESIMDFIDRIEQNKNI